MLPHNLDAERSLLGAALLYEQQADYVVDKLHSAAFYRRAHQTIFEAVRDLRQHGRGVDLTLLREALGPKRLEAVGGPAYLSALADGLPRSTNVSHYAEVVLDLAAKRALYEFGRLTLDHVVAGQHSARTLLDDADRRLVEIAGGHVEGRVLALRATSDALLEDLEWRMKHRGELLGLDTGYPSINELTSGWQAGDLTVIGARPSIGKTTFLLNTAVAAARTILAAKGQEVVLLFSPEMRRRQLEYRLMSQLSGVPMMRLKKPECILQSEWSKVSAAIVAMRELPIVIDDRAGQNRWQIRSTCRRIKAEHGLALVGIDYVQLVVGSLDRRGANRNEEITDISRGIKELADELTVPILLLSQLSRPTRLFKKADAADPAPRLTDLRESGALEQDADNVAFLHRKHHRDGGVTLFILEKQRNGSTGSTRLTLDKEIVTFTDGGEEEKPAEEKKPAGPKKVTAPAIDRYTPAN